MKYKVTLAHGTYTVRAETNHGEETIASIKRNGKFYIVTIRGICGPSAPRYTQTHDTLKEACFEAFDIWNTYGRHEV